MRPHHITPAALPRDAAPIGQEYGDLLARLRRAKAVLAHGAAIEATGRTYEDQPGEASKKHPKSDRAQEWYRWSNVAERALP